MAHIMSQAHMLKGATPFEQREFIRSMVTRQLSMGTTPQYQQTQQTLMDYFGIQTMQEPQAAAGAGLPPAPAPPPAPGSSVAATYAGSESTATTYPASSASSSSAPPTTPTEPSYTPSIQEMVNRAMGRVDYLTSSVAGSLTDSRPSSPEHGRTRLTQAALAAHQMERNRFAIGGEESHEDTGEYMAPTGITDESRFGSGGVFTSFALPSAPASRDGFGNYAGAAPFIHSGDGFGAATAIGVTKGGRRIYETQSQGTTHSRGRGSEPSEPSFDPSVSSGEREQHRQRLSALKSAKAESSGSSSGPVVPGKPKTSAAKKGKKKGKK